MITSFRIQNLRAIEDSGPIQLRRINVLVGRNSSGKSTILRLLPLLRQSVEQQTKGPILWYGRLVDFGDFKNAVRDGNVARGITLAFDVTLVPKRGFSSRLQRAKETDGLIWPRSGLKASLSLILGRSASDKVGQIKSLVLNFGSDDVSIEYGEDGSIKNVVVMGRPARLAQDNAWWVRQGKFIPGLYLLSKETYSDGDDDPEFLWEPVERPFSSAVVTALGHLAHGNTSPERLVAISNRLSYGDAPSFFRQLLEMPGMPPSLKYRIEQLGQDSSEIATLRRCVMLSKIDSLLRAVDDELERFARSVRYVEPIRATAERFYREQDLAVDEIDSRGTNTAMFLGSLSQDVLGNLQGWMLRNFGFSVHVETGTGHVQVQISDSTHSPRNIADLGFGYSQVLPIILQLWQGTRGRTGGDGVMLAMEQPELHLHPQYQAMLADVISVATQGGNLRTESRIFVETHSDHFVNRLGLLVSQGKIPPKDIQVIVVCEDEFGDSTARSVSFDSDGTLTANWPAGFFTPSL